MSHRRRSTSPGILLVPALAALAMAMAPGTIAAQHARPVAATRLAPAALVDIDRQAMGVAAMRGRGDTTITPGPSGGERFGMELLGGALGSALGLAGAIATQDRGGCGDDIACAFGRTWRPLIASTVGAAVGTYVVGRSSQTDPEPVGAVLGAVLGVAGGVMAAAVAYQQGGSGEQELRLALAYVGGQALMTAAGSRIGAAIRDQGR